ncbi:efflux RND transporter permease subunit [Bradyrhizobium centrolobii]|uniref:efflux RND transporter permease subunit n=1 Tax=Bradyrhizobium centrolobii TaxID=1505087 RepID=UPI0007C45932|nr:efflux RND transporter permease subunit [Bradyrhizobium centrolobii]
MAVGFSINLLTLLALVLVVDDAIIVVENVNRHLEAGNAPVIAAIEAARELGRPIAMTVVLVAVYVPIAFQGGLTGALFTEFTLVGTVTISAIVALTLSPMMSSRLLKPHGATHGWQARFTALIDRCFEALRRLYLSSLRGSLEYLPITCVFALLVLSSIYLLYADAKSELAPQEDQGGVITTSTLAPDATLEQKVLYARQVFQIMKKYPETDHVFQTNSPARVVAGMVLKPWDERTRTSNQLRTFARHVVHPFRGTGHLSPDRDRSFPPGSAGRITACAVR